ncbi:MAG: hypothetical protein NT007_05885, partial [Candidatus Kapabacteria bacterium]|nr:hypothetical protein [Candidatus Kapabacteria bacterium]
MNNKYQIPTAIAFIAMILLYINSNLFAYDDWELVKGPFCGHFTCFGEDLNKKLFAGSWGDGLYQLSSDGSTWTKVSTNLADPYITCIFIDSSNKIYVGSNGNGVSVSTNSGVNWTKIASGLTNLNIKSIIKNASNHLLAATNGSGVFRSTNNGTSWVESNTGLWFRDVNALIKCNTGAIIAATNGGGFYNSTDGGISWRKSNAATSGSVIKLEFAYQLAMQTDGSVFATTPNRGVLYSVDNGLSWDEQDTTNYINFNTNAIAFNKKRYTVAGTRTNGVIYHDDLVYSAWAQSNMKQIAPDAIIRASSGTLYAAFPMKGIYKSTNDATDWVKQSFGTYNSGIIGLTTYKNGIMFAGRDWGGAFISTDYGNTWTSAGLNSYRAGFFAFDSSGNVLAATNKGLYKSTDKGTSWALLGLRDSISFISVTPSGVLFVIDSVLQKSTDNGTTWSIITLAHGLKGDPIPTLNVATNKNGDVYAFVPGEGIYKAPNPGTSFLNVNNSLEAGLRNYGIVFNNAGHIYCSVGQFGVLLSTDNGTNWTLDTLGAKLHNTVGVAFNSRSVPYAITTDGGGIWEKNTVNNWNPYNTNIELWDMQSITSNEKGYMYVTTDAVYMLRDSNKLAIPTLISPASGTTNVDIQIPFSWNPATDIETFEFQLSDDKDFKTTIEYRTQAQTIDNNEKLFDFATKYYWRVRTKFNSHVGEWSEIRSFTTVAAPPVLISPINNSRGIRRSHDLIWHTVPNVNKYEYQVATDTIFTSVSANQIINADTTATITLKDYTVYHWRARSVVGTGIFSPWSKYNTYLTAVAPPQLTSPADKSSGMDTVVVMTWDTSVASTKYIILISKSPDFSPDSIIYEGTTDENNRHRMPLLQFNKTYWWKIKAGN